jgi:DNA-binding transcriptional MerR regulator
MHNSESYRKELPDKLYFRIGEVGELAEIPTYVLRFWESEFKKIKPKRTSSGQRLYKKNDVELILEIKHLLYDKKYTIQGAKQHLESRTPQKKEIPSKELLEDIRLQLIKIRDILS